MLKKRLTVIMIVLFALLPTTSQAEPGVSDKEVRIGEILPLTGPASLAGLAHSLGTKIALEEANANGGVGGRKVIAITEDDGYVPARAFQAAQKLIKVKDVFAITGTSGTSHTNAMMPLLIENKVLTIVSINPNQQAFTPPKKPIFVVGTNYGSAIYRIVEYAAKELKKNKARYGIIFQDDDYGANVKDGYLRAIKKFGLNNVVEIPYKRGQKDFSAEMLRVASKKVDVLISGGIISENVAVLKEAAKLGLDGMITGTVWTAHLPIVQKLAGVAGDGYLTADYTATLKEENAKPFLELAKKYLNQDELKKVNRYSMTAYAGARLLILAMRECKDTLTRTCVIGKLDSGKEYNVGSIMSPISFTPQKRLSGSTARVLKNDFKNKSFVPLTKF